MREKVLERMAITELKAFRIAVREFVFATPILAIIFYQSTATLFKSQHMHSELIARAAQCSAIGCICPEGYYFVVEFILLVISTITCLSIVYFWMHVFYEEFFG